MKNRWLVPVAGIAALLLLLQLCTFTVGEGQYAVRTRFRQVLQADYAPGLHWCLPIDRIEKVDRRVLSQRFQGESFLTQDQQGLLVDIDLSWRVRDAAAYLRSGAGDEQTVSVRLGDVLRSELKAHYSRQSLATVIAEPRGGLSPALLAKLVPVAAILGIEVVDARVKRIDPTDEVVNAIYARMQAAYAAQTRQLRSESAAEGERLRAEAERNRAEILANANRDAQRVRGEGDAQAALIYARSYGANPEFAAFYRSLQAYRAALGREGDILVIQPDGDFYKYLRSPARR
jgi:modulator of FtsH protease HflC